MSEKVVTEFELQIGQFEQQLQALIKRMEAFEKTTGQTEQSTSDLSGELGNASEKFKALEVSSKKADKGLKEVKAAATDFGKELGETAKELTGLGGAFGRLGQSALTLGRTVIAALGPIGIAVTGIVAVFAALTKVFFGTERGSETLDRSLSILSAVFGRLLGIAQRVAFTLVDTFSNPRKAVEDLWAAIEENISNRLTGLIDQFQALGNVIAGVFTLDADRITNGVNNFGESTIQVLTGVDDLAGKVANGFTKLGSEISDAAKDGLQIEKLKEQLEDLALVQAKREGELNRVIAEQLDIARDVNRTSEERKASADAAIQAQNELSGLAAKQNALEVERLALQQKQNDTSIEGQIELARLRAQGDQIEADRLGANRRAQAISRSIDAQNTAQAVANAKRVAEARVAAATQAAELEAALAERSELEGLQGVDRRVREVQIGYEKERAAAQRLFDELAALYPKDAEKRAEVAQQAATAIAAITQSEIAATTALREEAQKEEQAKAQEALEGVRQITTARDVLEREAINKRFDEARTAAEQNITDAQELADTLVAIERARVVAVSQVRSEEDELLARQQEQRIALLSSASDQVTGIVQAVAEGNIKTAQEAGKAILRIALDVAEKQALIAISNATVGSLSSAQSIATGGTLGIAQAAVLATLIRGAFALLKSQLAGSFYDGGIVGRDGGTKFSAGRDGYLVRAHQGEYIMPTQKTNQYMPYLEMMRDGTFDRWVSTIAGSNASTTATAVPSFNDRGIVGALGGVGSLSEQRKQTELLAMVARGLSRGQNKRYRA